MTGRSPPWPVSRCARPCEAEYVDPADRRFHAQPTCCPQCGPQLSLIDAIGKTIPGDPIDVAARLLNDGRILAIKGLGGYHLAVNASDAHAVRRLRQRKKRDSKPFALMVRDLSVLSQVVELDDDACGVLRSPMSPIVLLPRLDRDDTAPDPIAPAVAPNMHRLGIMLPNTPIQHLLFATVELANAWLVMTSANQSDDPLVIEDGEARRRLDGIADAYLLHDRPIHRAVDDSIVMQVPDGLLPIRRARGYVPSPIPLPQSASQPGLCVGAELKNTVCIVREREAILSQHLGDLTYALACDRFERTIDDLLRLFDVAPAWIACDLHPDIQSHRYAQQRAARDGIPVIPIQHHHAHAASLMAEHNRIEPITTVVCDGVGLGDDGTAWGGEILITDLQTYSRPVRLRPLALPGGDAAAKETIRCALSWLVDALEDDHDHRDAVATRIVRDDARRAVLMQMLQRHVQCPLSSGTGRLFDAAAAVLGVCVHNEYEAQSGMMLEALAHDAPSIRNEDDLSDLLPLRDAHDARGAAIVELDHRPLLRCLLEEQISGTPIAHLARLFHEALANGWLRAALHAVNDGAPTTVGLTGGVFCNALLTELLTARLADAGLRVLRHHLVPPNDGGIAYGQAAIAAARLACDRS
jgi:hydrogenase maturation protein HypF